MPGLCSPVVKEVSSENKKSLTSAPVLPSECCWCQMRMGSWSNSSSERKLSSTMTFNHLWDRNEYVPKWIWTKNGSIRYGGTLFICDISGTRERERLFLPASFPTHGERNQEVEMVCLPPWRDKKKIDMHIKVLVKGSTIGVSFFLSRLWPRNLLWQRQKKRRRNCTQWGVYHGKLKFYREVYFSLLRWMKTSFHTLNINNKSL